MVRVMHSKDKIFIVMIQKRQFGARAGVDSTEAREKVSDCRMIIVYPSTEIMHWIFFYDCQRAEVHETNPKTERYIKYMNDLSSPLHFFFSFRHLMH